LSESLRDAPDALGAAGSAPLRAKAFAHEERRAGGKFTPGAGCAWLPYVTCSAFRPSDRATMARTSWRGERWPSAVDGIAPGHKASP
jgi:hypothetical protein